MNLLAQHAQKFVPLKSNRNLQGYKQAELLPLKVVLAEMGKPKGKPRLTKRDAVSPAIVTLHRQEWRPPKRW